MRIRKASSRWLLSFAHAFVLLALAFLFTAHGYTYGFDKLLVRWCSVVKHVAFKADNDIRQQDYLFVDLSAEKALIPLDDSSGNEVITDRARLTKFFQIVKQHQKEIRFTLCDVFLEGHSPADTALLKAVSGIQNIVFPTHFNQEGHIEPIIMPVPHALADYDSDSEFFKFKLFQSDTLPTIPVYMYERLSGRKLIDNSLWPTDNGHLMLNSVIIDYPLRAYEVFDEHKYTVVKLNDLFSLPADVMVNNFLKNRIVVMGDFKGDIHESIYGPVPGSLVLLDIYLTLTKGHHLVSPWWLISLLVAFTFLSHFMFFTQVKRKLKKINKWLGLLTESFGYLVLLSITSYFVFSQPVEAVILTIYINAVTFIIQVHRGGWTFTNLKKEFVKLIPQK
jgi:hypothetical protein